MTVAIVGAGTMGRRIAFGCVAQEIPVTLFDAAPAASEAAVAAVHALLGEWVARGRLSAGAVESGMRHLVVKATLADCVSEAELVIEAVPEDLGLKRRVFAEIDRHASGTAVIASNSSAIPGSWLATATTRPERVINLNFGTPDHLKVEVMPHAGTAPDTLQRALAFVRALGLVPVSVRREVVGYATNRVWRAVKKEVLSLLDQDVVSPEDIDRAWMLDWGTPIGPCGLMDKVGLDVVRDIELIYHRASGDPSDQPPRILLDLIARGKLGEKSGEGFYRYPNPAYSQPGWLTQPGNP